MWARKNSTPPIVPAESTAVEACITEWALFAKDAVHKTVKRELTQNEPSLIVLPHLNNEQNMSQPRRVFESSPKERNPLTPQGLGETES